MIYGILIAVGLIFIIKIHGGLQKLTRRLDILELQLSPRDTEQQPSETEPTAAAVAKSVPLDAGVASAKSEPQKPTPVAAQKPFSTRPKTNLLENESIPKAIEWLKVNWFYAVAALCLALAGVFLVQYGVENGLLTPFWRVLAALGLGFALIAGGELARRNGGDKTMAKPPTCLLLSPVQELSCCS